MIHARDERRLKPSVRSTWDAVQYGTPHEAGQEAAAVCVKQGAEAGAMLGEFSERGLRSASGTGPEDRQRRVWVETRSSSPSAASGHNGPGDGVPPAEQPVAVANGKALFFGQGRISV
ncbi:MAG: hypothetical protein IPF60_16365 [Betaproteobacteria bacterium]|nr:hypothetical protein [Betaproteobacteria bacterium]